MGGILTLLLSSGELVSELVASTGLSVEALLTGEALAALEAEVTSVMTIQGISGIEALAQLGFTAEQFANMSVVASLFSEGIALGTLFQTVSGVSSLVAAGIRLGIGQSSTVNSSALLHGEDRLLRHVLMAFSLNPLQWDQSIIHAIDGPLTLNAQLRGLVLGSRWVVQMREDTSPSGTMIDLHLPQGLSHEQGCPDWLLPLILGLSGDQTPELQYLEHGAQKKRR
ncbi:minor capsid protein VP2 [Rhinolophus sinicus polyomavirus 1]|nr:minor capsid protein VP2 [Rhinolophus sinicus polyomavirus 1]